jgi:tetratricopeptide (TPR) repeat protein
MSINSPSVDPTVKDKLELRRSQQLEFVQTALREIGKSNTNPDLIYSLFHQNLGLIDLDIVEILRDFTNTRFSKINLNQERSGFNIINRLKNWANTKLLKIGRYNQKSITVDILNLGNLLQQFPLGDQAINIELSIECYEIALKIFTVGEDLINWGSTQNNLATAYSGRTIGDRAENLERSIKGYESALQVYTRAFPIQWAMLQNNLANVYFERIRGDRAENLGQSIKGYESALKVYANGVLPLQRAETQHNLANAHSKRIRGDQKENLEQSIESYRSAIQLCNPESFPCEWVKIQMSLARFSIENLGNYQVATEHLQSAYEYLLTNNNDTGLLAQTMFELARCFHQTGCLEQAKIYFKDSIRLYQRLEQQTQVAAATSALGNLELQMGLLNDARLHLQTALEFYQAAGNPERVESIQELQQYLPVTSGASGS